MDERMQRAVSMHLSEANAAPTETSQNTAAEARPSRRDFLKKAGVVGTVAASTTAIGAGYVAGGGSDQEDTKRFAMVIDMRRCTGCRTCAVACKAENGVRLGGFRSWVSQQETGKYPHAKRHFLPRLCNHCQNAACLKVCPPGATYKRDDGLVLVNKDRCIGCRHCMVACPYGVRYFNSAHDPEGEELSPSRTHGTVDKCTFCAHRIESKLLFALDDTALLPAVRMFMVELDRGIISADLRERFANHQVSLSDDAQVATGERGNSWLITDSREVFMVAKEGDTLNVLGNGVVPSCVNARPARARTFGDLNDPDSKVSRLLADEVATTLLSELGTRPSVFYIGAQPQVFVEQEHHAEKAT